MNRFSIKTNFLCLVILILLARCGRTKTEVVWVNDLPVIGSQSSPRTTDLNGDGVLDIVMGAGKNEFQFSKQGIVAFDGKTGKLLWQQDATDQVYGSATFCDVTGDGVKDVFIGGRSPHFKAINGKTGELLWEYKYDQHKQDPIMQYARFNFNNCALVPDQNHDGLPELLTVNGGNASAAPNSVKDRYPAVLILFDPKTGSIIAADTMPDGKESYLAPVSFVQPGTKEYMIVFGTGGETISGNLYLAKLADLLERKLSNAKVIASEIGHGFIAPPVLADISGDGYLDIIAISHGSKIIAIDGKDQKIRWQRMIDNTESSNSFAVGYFTGDNVPDFFTFVSKGAWPNSTGSLQIMIDGKNGDLVYSDSIGCTGFSSPVVYDLDGDGYDEAILSVNEYDCSLGYAGKSPSRMETRLISIDFKRKSVKTIDQMTDFKNIFSTPWIGDMDYDGYLDIVHCQYYNPPPPGELVSFLGMSIKRIATPIRIRKPVLWGAYRGSNGDGLFTLEQPMVK